MLQSFCFFWSFHIRGKSCNSVANCIPGIVDLCKPDNGITRPRYFQQLPFNFLIAFIWNPHADHRVLECNKVPVLSVQRGSTSKRPKECTDQLANRLRAKCAKQMVRLYIRGWMSRESGNTRCKAVGNADLPRSGSVVCLRKSHLVRKSLQWKKKKNKAWKEWEKMGKKMRKSTSIGWVGLCQAGTRGKRAWEIEGEKRTVQVAFCYIQIFSKLMCVLLYQVWLRPCLQLSKRAKTCINVSSVCCVVDVWYNADEIGNRLVGRIWFRTSTQVPWTGQNNTAQLHRADQSRTNLYKPWLIKCQQCALFTGIPKCSKLTAGPRASHFWLCLYSNYLVSVRSIDRIISGIPASPILRAPEWSMFDGRYSIWNERKVAICSTFISWQVA